MVAVTRFLLLLAVLLSFVLLMPAEASTGEEAISVSPPAGPAGQTVTVYGTGWREHGTRGIDVPIWIGFANVVARGHPDANGVFQVSFTIPLTSPVGQLEISAIIGNGGSANTFYTVTAGQGTIREPGESILPPVYSSELPQGKAPNLIVIVHGCCTANLDKMNELRSSIQNSIIRNQTPGTWEIVVWDWRSDPWYLNYVPLWAYLDAFQQGKRLWQHIASYPSYKYVHFVAHSAGSNLINTTISYLNVSNGSLITHATFLDAYSPFSDVSLNSLPLSRDEIVYGLDADYAEQYVDFGLPETATNLRNAYNFDITGLSHSPIDITFGHGWPIEWYKQSIDNLGYSFEFSLSFENNGNDPVIFYTNLKQTLQSQLNISAGDVCVLTSNTECIPNPIGLLRPIIVYTKLVGSLIIDAIKTSVTGTIEWLMGDELTGVSATLRTGSPVWFEAPITTTQTYNFIKFDYEFLSAPGSQGIMTVFVDDQPVYKIDERITYPEVNTARDIPVGVLAPGTHTIGFRLDPFTDVQSVARISNIELGEFNTPQTVTKPVFVYPADGQTVGYKGSYLFKVKPIANAQGFLWGFFQNGVMVWENYRDEGTLSSNEYGIHPGTTAYSKFVPGSVEVWVRALINGQWTDATIITIHLQ